ncbi:MAG TPA: hypothetical protein VM536_20320 [Chloroflexia bacterium]|nr:hypothetical protein [Chloroflexia bacterium]
MWPWLFAWWPFVGLLLPTTGRVYYYEPGVFAHVARVRGMDLAWGQVDGFASTPYCRLVDARRPWVVTARIDGGPVERFQIVDCSAPRDRAHHQAEGLVLEVDYTTALRHLGKGRTRLRLDGKAPVTILGYGRRAGISPAR